MIQPTPNPTGAQWARFRFSVVGSLLSSPPARNAPISDPLPGSHDLVAPCNRARSPLRKNWRDRSVLMTDRGAQARCSDRPSPDSCSEPSC